MGKQVDPTYWRIRLDLQRVLNEPLAGGRGFQHQQDKKVHALCQKLAEYELPPRG